MAKCLNALTSDVQAKAQNDLFKLDASKDSIIETYNDNNCKSESGSWDKHGTDKMNHTRKK